MAAGVDLALMPEVDARAALQGYRIRFQVLAPVGAWLGVGRLRVLRLKEIDSSKDRGQPEIELICGYESYERL
jgi:hypothetical protein